MAPPCPAQPSGSTPDPSARDGQPPPGASRLLTLARGRAAHEHHGRQPAPRPRSALSALRDGLAHAPSRPPVRPRLRTGLPARRRRLRPVPLPGLQLPAGWAAEPSRLPAALTLPCLKRTGAKEAGAVRGTLPLPAPPPALTRAGREGEGRGWAGPGHWLGGAHRSMGGARRCR